MRQFFTVSAICVGFLTLMVMAYLWYFDPFGFTKPNDRDLISYFHTHRQTFDQLGQLALSDQGKVGEVQSSNLDELPFSASHRQAYRVLLNQLGHCADISIDQYEVRFICSSGGLSAISRGWSKGISYLPNGSQRVGKIVKDLDSIAVQDDEFLRPIGGSWYLSYEDID